MFIESGGFRQHPASFADLVAGGDRVKPGNAHPSRIRIEDAVKQANGSGFSRAIGAQNANNLTLLHGKREIINDLYSGEKGLVHLLHTNNWFVHAFTSH